jgi:hypothetical protein
VDDALLWLFFANFGWSQDCKMITQKAYIPNPTLFEQVVYHPYAKVAAILRNAPRLC